MKRLTGIAVAVLLAVPTTVAVQTGTDGSSFLLAFSVNLCRLLNRILDQSMRHSPLYAALALSIFGIPATASERFEQWSLEAQGEGTFAFVFRRPIRTQNSIGPGLAFICNQESKYVVAIVAPIPGTFKNDQESIPVAIQKSEDGYDPSDLLQRWENEGEYIFSEITGDQEYLTSYHFPNDLDATMPTTNHIVIDLPGFSRGLEAFKKKCGETQ